jgi:hypothetical protein
VTLSLASRVQSLHKLVAVMNIDSMRNETRVFVRNLLAEVSRPSGARETEETPDHHQSDFARWYEGAGRELFGNLPAFQEVEAPHAGLFAAASAPRCGPAIAKKRCAPAASCRATSRICSPGWMR